MWQCFPCTSRVDEGIRVRMTGRRSARAATWPGCTRTASPNASCSRGYRSPASPAAKKWPYGRSLQRHLAHFNLPVVFTDWAPLAQDRAGWLKLVTTPFKLGKPFVRQPRGDTRVTPEDRQRLAEQRAAEIAKRRADFSTINN